MISRRVLLVCTVIGGQLATTLFARSGAALWQTSIPWLLSLAFALVLVHGHIPKVSRPDNLIRNPDLWAVLGLTILAGFLRLPRLETLPAGIYGDEGEFGTLALAVSKGDGPNPFGVAFLGDPALYVHLLSPFIAVLGPTMEAIRLPSALIGTATVPVLYGFVRNLNGRFAAMIAAFLLATAAVHIHFSRLALNIVWVPFFTCLALWLLKRGLDSRQGAWFLLAGMTGGIGFYFHFGARLIIPMLLLFLLTQYVVKFRDWPVWTRATGMVIVGALLALNPLLTVLSDNPMLLTAHTNKRGIWNNWQKLADRYETVPSDKVGILWQQTRHTFTAFISEPDSRYGALIYRFTDQPLLPALIGLLSVLGMIWLLSSLRTDRSRLILIWLLVPCVFASILTDVAGQAHRLVNPMLAGLIATALVVDLARQFFWARLTSSVAGLIMAAILMALVLVGTRDSYRYLQPGATDPFGVPGTAQARCIEALPPEIVTLIDGAPKMYARHGASRYLGNDVIRRDIDDVHTELPAEPEQLVILVHEWNHGDVVEILAIFPNAAMIEIERPPGSRAMTVIAFNKDRQVSESILQACQQNADA